MRAQLPLRLARTAAFAAVCVALAALAHWLGGGTGPAPQVAGAGLAIAFAAGLALSGRERPGAVIITVLGVLQFGLHELFALFSGDGAAYVPVHGHAQGQGLAISTGMLVSHLTATLITGWWLARGEAALWSLLRRVGGRFVLLRPLAVPAPPRVAPVVVSRVVPPLPVLRLGVARRGPPLPA
ncbi:MFS transporter [Nonomuraea sp. NN258]|uniref:MFS transporter n=1 Tax=Nonomuraea antri TaxID=2730852 RepID=UPI001567F7C3|nr:MFS transporter [Nonomuraea antri]NRQ36824.1 MFS transporter [Nonomuraea antri]